MIHPEDRERVRVATEKGRRESTSFSLYHRIIRDGIVRNIYCENHFEFNSAGIPLSLYGVSHDVTELKIAEEKLVDANRMYAFTSQLNQTIVHVTDEASLFDGACRIAVEIGKFEMAFIDLVSEKERKLELMTRSNANADDGPLFGSMVYAEDGAMANTIQNGKYHVINDYSKEPEQSFWSEFAFSRDFQSAIILPIKKAGETRYVLSLFSRKANIFDQEEILLLEEAANEISFALDAFESKKEREKFEHKLQHNELRLRQAQEIAHLGSWELNFSSGKVLWSEEACKIYGLSAEHNVQSYDTWLSFIHPDDFDRLLKVTKESEERLTGTSFFHRIIRRDGVIRHIHSQTEFEFKDGKPVGLYGVVHDITGQREAEEALRQSNENIHQIVDLIPQAIYAKDIDGRFIFVNKSFGQLYGEPPENLVSKTLDETLPGKNASDYFLKEDLEVILTGITKIIPEVIFTDYTGKRRIFYTIKVPYTLPGKTEKAVLGISMDITEQKKAEGERNKMVEDIVQRNKNLEQFSYIVSHNLRAPVANILGLSELMKITTNEEIIDSKIMDELFVSVNKLDMVIRDLNHVLQVKNESNEKKTVVIFLIC
jgi:PAS domain S-box-containing protein